MPPTAAANDPALPAPGFVKLDALENPFRLTAALPRELGARLGRVAINRYPAQCVADEIAALLDAEAEEAEKVLPRVMSFVVSPEQEELIESAVELASDGTPGRDRKARGLANLARRFLAERSDEANTQQGS